MLRWPVKQVYSTERMVLAHYLPHCCLSSVVLYEVFGYFPFFTERGPLSVHPSAVSTRPAAAPKDPLIPGGW